MLFRIVFIKLINWNHSALHGKNWHCKNGPFLITVNTLNKTIIAKVYALIMLEILLACFPEFGSTSFKNISILSINHCLILFHNFAQIFTRWQITEYYELCCFFGIIFKGMCCFSNTYQISSVKFNLLFTALQIKIAAK